MKVFIEKTGKHLVLEGRRSAADILKDLSINPESIILVKNNEIALDDEFIEDKDELRILSVISGG
jgi:sulfur carrier protein ThiS